MPCLTDVGALRWGPWDASARLPASRKARIAAHVADVGQVTVPALADRFGVSADTIRRDLDQLDLERLVVRTHGGAISPTSLPRADTAVNVRMQLQTAAKEQIGPGRPRV